VAKERNKELTPEKKQQAMNVAKRNR